MKYPIAPIQSSWKEAKCSLTNCNRQPDAALQVDIDKSAWEKQGIIKPPLGGIHNILTFPTCEQHPNDVIEALTEMGFKPFNISVLDPETIAEWIKSDSAKGEIDLSKGRETRGKGSRK